MENSTPGSSVATVPPDDGQCIAPGRRRSGRCSDRRRPRPPRPRPGRRGPGRAGWRAPGRSSPAARPAASTARRLVRAERPLSQNTSIHRACGGACVQHRAAHQVHVAGHVAGELRRHHVRAEVGDLRGDLGGQRDPAGLVGHGEAVAGLALEGGRALARASRPPAGPGWRAGRRRTRPGSPPPWCRMPPAWYGRPGHPGRELGAALAGEDQVRVRVDEPGQHRPAAGVDHRSAAGARAAGPVQATGPSVMTRAASAIAAKTPQSGSFVTSSPTFVITPPGSGSSSQNAPRSDSSAAIRRTLSWSSRARCRPASASHWFKSAMMVKILAHRGRGGPAPAWRLIPGSVRPILMFAGQEGRPLCTPGRPGRGPEGYGPGRNEA